MSIPDRRPQVIVAHPGTQHSYQTAIGLQRAGMLKAYVTSFYYKKRAAGEFMLNALPSGTQSLLRRELERRRNATLDPNRVWTRPLPELLYVASARSKVIRSWPDTLIRWRNRGFDAHAARLVRAHRPDAMISYNSCARLTFDACREQAVYAFLDQTIGHMKIGIALLREEAEAHPAFADSLGITDSDALIDQDATEALTADCVLAPSEFVRDTLVAAGVDRSKIEVLPYGADTVRFTPSTQTHKPFRVLFVGGISQRKGIKYLLEAFKRLKLPDAELVLAGGIVGSGAGLRPYADCFRHIPHIPHREVHTLFQSADVFVYPSLFEGSALAIYEALASGLPVVTTPNAGSVVRDGIDGYVVPIRDVDRVMEKILRLYEDHDLRRAMGQSARKRAESFTWATYQSSLCDLVISRTASSKRP